MQTVLQPISVGIRPNDHAGDDFRTAMIKQNAMNAGIVADLIALFGSGADLTTLAAQVASTANKLSNVLAGANPALDSFLEAYNRFLADESTAAALQTSLGILQTAVTGKSPNTYSAPTISPTPATKQQIIASRFSLAHDGGWGASQADNDRIFQNALAYCANTANGAVEIELPMGTWPLTVPRAQSTTKPFSFRGPHRGAAQVVVNTGGSPLLTLTQQTVGAQIAVEGIEFVAASPGVATPLVLAYAGTAQGPSPYYQYSGLTLRDLSFIGAGRTATTGANYFLNGFDLANCWQPIIDGVHFTGSVTNRRSALAGGIFRYCFAAQVHNFFAQYAVRAMYLPGGATNGQNDEGFAWHSGEAVDVDYGITAVGTDADPGFFIGPVHINAGKACIQTVYKSQIDVSRALLYKLAGDSNDFNALDIQNAAYGYISAIQIGDSRASNTGGAFTGLKLTNCIGMTVNGIQAQGWLSTANTLVYLAGTTDGCNLLAVDASRVSGLAPVGFDATVGPNNKFRFVDPAPVQGLTVNSATPSVGNDRSGLFTTSNSSATSITDFPNGYSGQMITIFPQDNVTSLVHSAALRLKGAPASPVLIPVGSSISFRRFGSSWLEIGRAF